uniref:Myozenin 1b n=1 Tax=Sphaeramia orbicularis TaxID=375764 RepID=A0A673ASR4_9TELE
MPVTTPAPPNKRKKANRIITDLSNVSQNDDESDSEAAELDLGTKIKTPKDTMLEELSLLTNKGSKMFKMRQQRVERFIVTNENMVRTSGRMVQGDEEVNTQEEKERRRKAYIRTYVSPWERAMKGNEELTATMKASMPGPIQIHLDLPQYKSFNRTALPFGGFDKACKSLTFELPEVHLAPEEPEPLPSLQADIRSRPSFNRTPIGWVCSDDCTNIHMDLDIPFDGETEDL